MPRFGQLVIGPAGCGKSTYCYYLQKYAECVLKRNVMIVNLDPAAEHFDYAPVIDVRNLVSLDDVTYAPTNTQTPPIAQENCSVKFSAKSVIAGDASLGPNGGLLYAFDYLSRNLSWLADAIFEVSPSTASECDYFLFDCPGQIELYTHAPSMPRIAAHLLTQLEFRLCSVFVLDSHFLLDKVNLISASLTALSSRIHLGLTHFNVMMKVDQLSPQDKRKMRNLISANAADLLQPIKSGRSDSVSNKWLSLNRALADAIDQFELIKFVPVDLTSLAHLDGPISLLLEKRRDAAEKENEECNVADEDEEEICADDWEAEWHAMPRGTDGEDVDIDAAMYSHELQDLLLQIDIAMDFHSYLEPTNQFYNETDVKLMGPLMEADEETY